MAKYNGWKNYETWNVALWIGNDEGLYNAAKEFVQTHKVGPIYRRFAEFLGELGITQTPDKVHYLGKGLCYSELNAMMREL